jgi:glutamate formiminotransferase
MSRRLIECVPNFSEGRDAGKVAAIREAIRSAHGVLLLKSEMDPDHNRSVITFVGPPDEAVAGAFRGIAKACESIDLRQHAGVHPRIGAADVVPLVPLDGMSLPDCAALARQLGHEVWHKLGVPVYFYEAVASLPERVRLENVRRGGFENPRFLPDLGGPKLHPTAGACIIGARRFLIAFNINLDTPDVTIARDIARRIRASDGGLPCLKAIGVLISSRNLAQVSMNLTNFEHTSMRAVFDAVKTEAAERGVGLVDSEIIGLVPRAALNDHDADAMLIKNYSADLILEHRIETALQAARPNS